MKYDTRAKVEAAVTSRTDLRCCSMRIANARIAVMANRVLHRVLRNSGR